MTKKVKVEIELFSYDELEESSKEKAFYKHEEFLNSIGTEFENKNGEMETDYSDIDKETVEDSLRINEYLFFRSGELADCVTYTGKHEKSGITEFKFEGVVYTL